MNFLQRRIVNSVIVFLVVLNLDFFLPRLAPGNAAEILAAGSKVPQQAIILLEQRFGLLKPLYVQYELYLKGIFSWPPDFGISYGYYPDTVTHLFEVRIGWSMILLLSSLGFRHSSCLCGCGRECSKTRRQTGSCRDEYLGFDQLDANILERDGPSVDLFHLAWVYSRSTEMWTLACPA